MVQPGKSFDAAGYIRHLGEKRKRAQERLITAVPAWHFAVLGIRTDVQSYKFQEGVRFERVFDSPDTTELAGALKDAAYLGAVSRYMTNLQYELIVEKGDHEDDQCFTLAWLVISALRIRSLAEILIPCACNRSWSTISAHDDKSCIVHFVEDSPTARVVHETQLVGLGAFEWVARNLEDFAKGAEDKRFRMAIEAITTYHHHKSFRVMTALLWAGIESLFQISAELRFRLAILVSLTLERRGNACLDLYRRIKKLYDVRSKAVHGSGIDDEALRFHIVEVRELLSRLLCKFTELKKVPTEDDLDRLILSEA